MKLLFVAAIVALCVAIGESCERHGAKCPVYNVVESNENYEVREYPSLVWVSASGDGKSKSDVSRKLIKKIYNYLAGANDRAESLDMMVPVRTKKVVHEGYNTYTLAIGVSMNQSSDSPPKPADSSITVAREPPTTYIVRSFDGYVRQDSIWDAHAETLRASLPSRVSPTPPSTTSACTTVRGAKTTDSTKFGW